MKRNPALRRLILLVLSEAKNRGEKGLTKEQITRRVRAKLGLDPRND